MAGVRQMISTGVVLVLIGCQTLATADDVPARIVNPTEASRKALQEVVSSALGTQVILANDALTVSSLLTLEHNPPGSTRNLPAQGRTLSAPIQFRLLRNGADCILVDPRDGARHILAATNCVAE